EFVVDLASSLEEESLCSGDQVRWDRSSWMAVEKIDVSDGANLFLEETPAESFDQIGGLDKQIAELQRSMRLHFQNPEIVRKYRLRRAAGILLSGPPGTGKTMMARAL